MNAAGAALQIVNRSTKKGTTTMNQLADTIRITFKQHIDGFGHDSLKSHANIPVRSLSSSRCPREHPRDHVRSATMSSALSTNVPYPLFLYELDDYPSCYAYRSRMYISLDTSVRPLWQYRRYGAEGSSTTCTHRGPVTAILSLKILAYIRTKVLASRQTIES